MHNSTRNRAGPADQAVMGSTAVSFELGNDDGIITMEALENRLGQIENEEEHMTNFKKIVSAQKETLDELQASLEYDRTHKRTRGDLRKELLKSYGQENLEENMVPQIIDDPDDPLWKPKASKWQKENLLQELRARKKQDPSQFDSQGRARFLAVLNSAKEEMMEKAPGSPQAKQQPKGQATVRELLTQSRKQQTSETYADVMAIAEREMDPTRKLVDSEGISLDRKVVIPRDSMQRAAQLERSKQQEASGLDLGAKELDKVAQRAMRAPQRQKGKRMIKKAPPPPPPEDPNNPEDVDPAYGRVVTNVDGSTVIMKVKHERLSGFRLTKIEERIMITRNQLMLTKFLRWMDRTSSRLNDHMSVISRKFMGRSLPASSGAAEGFDVLGDCSGSADWEDDARDEARIVGALNRIQRSTKLREAPRCIGVVPTFLPYHREEASFLKEGGTARERERTAARIRDFRKSRGLDSPSTSEDDGAASAAESDLAEFETNLETRITQIRGCIVAARNLYKDIVVGDGISMAPRVGDLNREVPVPLGMTQQRAEKLARSAESRSRRMTGSLFSSGRAGKTGMDPFEYITNPNPYVVMRGIDYDTTVFELCRTEPLLETKAPCWDLEFSVTIPEQLSKLRGIEFHVYDYNDWLTSSLPLGLIPWDKGDYSLGKWVVDLHSLNHALSQSDAELRAMKHMNEHKGRLIYQAALVRRKIHCLKHRLHIQTEYEYLRQRITGLYGLQNLYANVFPNKPLPKTITEYGFVEPATREAVEDTILECHGEKSKRRSFKKGDDDENVKPPVIELNPDIEPPPGAPVRHPAVIRLLEKRAIEAEKLRQQKLEELALAEIRIAQMEAEEKERARQRQMQLDAIQEEEETTHTKEEVSSLTMTMTQREEEEEEDTATSLTLKRDQSKMNTTLSTLVSSGGSLDGVKNTAGGGPGANVPAAAAPIAGTNGVTPPAPAVFIKEGQHEAAAAAAAKKKAPKIPLDEKQQAMHELKKSLTLNSLVDRVKKERKETKKRITGDVTLPAFTVVVFGVFSNGEERELHRYPLVTSYNAFGLCPVDMLVGNSTLLGPNGASSNKIKYALRLPTTRPPPSEVEMDLVATLAEIRAKRSPESPANRLFADQLNRCRPVVGVKGIAPLQSGMKNVTQGRSVGANYGFTPLAESFVVHAPGLKGTDAKAHKAKIEAARQKMLEANISQSDHVKSTTKFKKDPRRDAMALLEDMKKQRGGVKSEEKEKRRRKRAKHIITSPGGTAVAAGGDHGEGNTNSPDNKSPGSPGTTGSSFYTSDEDSQSRGGQSGAGHSTDEDKEEQEDEEDYQTQLFSDNMLERKVEQALGKVDKELHPFVLPRWTYDFNRDNPFARQNSTLLAERTYARKNQMGEGMVEDLLNESPIDLLYLRFRVYEPSSQLRTYEKKVKKATDRRRARRQRELDEWPLFVEKMPYDLQQRAVDNKSQFVHARGGFKRLDGLFAKEEVNALAAERKRLQEEADARDWKAQLRMNQAKAKQNASSGKFAAKWIKKTEQAGGLEARRKKKKLEEEEEEEDDEDEEVEVEEAKPPTPDDSDMDAAIAAGDFQAAGKQSREVRKMLLKAENERRKAAGLKAKKSPEQERLEAKLARRQAREEKEDGERNREKEILEQSAKLNKQLTTERDKLGDLSSPTLTMDAQIALDAADFSSSASSGDNHARTQEDGLFTPVEGQHCTSFVKKRGASSTALSSSSSSCSSSATAGTTTGKKVAKSEEKARRVPKPSSVAPFTAFLRKGRFGDMFEALSKKTGLFGAGSASSSSSSSNKKQEEELPEGRSTTTSSKPPAKKGARCTSSSKSASSSSSSSGIQVHYSAEAKRRFPGLRLDIRPKKKNPSEMKSPEQEEEEPEKINPPASARDYKQETTNVSNFLQEVLGDLMSECSSRAPLEQNEEEEIILLSSEVDKPEIWSRKTENFKPAHVVEDPRDGSRMMGSSSSKNGGSSRETTSSSSSSRPTFTLPDSFSQTMDAKIYGEREGVQVSDRDEDCEQATSGSDEEMPGSIDEKSSSSSGSSGTYSNRRGSSSSSRQGPRLVLDTFTNPATGEKVQLPRIDEDEGGAVDAVEMRDEEDNYAVNEQFFEQKDVENDISDDDAALSLFSPSRSRRIQSATSTTRQDEGLHQLPDAVDSSTPGGGHNQDHTEQQGDEEEEEESELGAFKDSKTAAERKLNAKYPQQPKDPPPFVKDPDLPMGGREDKRLINAGRTVMMDEYERDEDVYHDPFPAGSMVRVPHDPMHQPDRHLPDAMVKQRQLLMPQIVEDVKERERRDLLDWQRKRYAYQTKTGTKVDLMIDPNFRTTGFAAEDWKKKSARIYGPPEGDHDKDGDKWFRDQIVQEDEEKSQQINSVWQAYHPDASSDEDAEVMDEFRFGSVGQLLAEGVYFLNCASLHKPETIQVDLYPSQAILDKLTEEATEALGGVAIDHPGGVMGSEGGSSGSRNHSTNSHGIPLPKKKRIQMAKSRSVAFGGQKPVSRITLKERITKVLKFPIDYGREGRERDAGLAKARVRKEMAAVEQVFGATLPGESALRAFKEKMDKKQKSFEGRGGTEAKKEFFPVRWAMATMKSTRMILFFQLEVTGKRYVLDDDIRRYVRSRDFKKKVEQTNRLRRMKKLKESGPTAPKQEGADEKPEEEEKGNLDKQAGEEEEMEPEEEYKPVTEINHIYGMIVKAGNVQTDARGLMDPADVHEWYESQKKNILEVTNKEKAKPVPVSKINAEIHEKMHRRRKLWIGLGDNLFRKHKSFFRRNRKSTTVSATGVEQVREYPAPPPVTRKLQQAHLYVVATVLDEQNRPWKKSVITRINQSCPANALGQMPIFNSDFLFSFGGEERGDFGLPEKLEFTLYQRADLRLNPEELEAEHQRKMEAGEFDRSSFLLDGAGDSTEVGDGSFLAGGPSQDTADNTNGGDSQDLLLQKSQQLTEGAHSSPRSLQRKRPAADSRSDAGSSGTGRSSERSSPSKRQRIAAGGPAVVDQSVTLTTTSTQQTKRETSKAIEFTGSMSKSSSSNKFLTNRQQREQDERRRTEGSGAGVLGRRQTNHRAKNLQHLADHNVFGKTRRSRRPREMSEKFWNSKYGSKLVAHVNTLSKSVAFSSNTGANNNKQDAQFFSTLLPGGPGLNDQSNSNFLNDNSTVLSSMFRSKDRVKPYGLGVQELNQEQKEPSIITLDRVDENHSFEDFPSKIFSEAAASEPVPVMQPGDIGGVGMFIREQQGGSSSSTASGRGERRSGSGGSNSIRPVEDDVNKKQSWYFPAGKSPSPPKSSAKKKKSKKGTKKQKGTKSGSDSSPGKLNQDGGGGTRNTTSNNKTGKSSSSPQKHGYDDEDTPSKQGTQTSFERSLRSWHKRVQKSQQLDKYRVDADEMADDELEQMSAMLKADREDREREQHSNSLVAPDSTGSTWRISTAGGGVHTNTRSSVIGTPGVPPELSEESSSNADMYSRGDELSRPASSRNGDREVDQHDGGYGSRTRNDRNYFQEVAASETVSFISSSHAQNANTRESTPAPYLARIGGQNPGAQSSSKNHVQEHSLLSSDIKATYDQHTLNSRMEQMTFDEDTLQPGSQSFIVNNPEQIEDNKSLELAWQIRQEKAALAEREKAGFYSSSGTEDFERPKSGAGANKIKKDNKPKEYGGFWLSNVLKAPKLFFRRKKSAKDPLVAMSSKQQMDTRAVQRANNAVFDGKINELRETGGLHTSVLVKEHERMYGDVGTDSRPGSSAQGQQQEQQQVNSRPSTTSPTRGQNQTNLNRDRFHANAFSNAALPPPLPSRQNRGNKTGVNAILQSPSKFERNPFDLKRKSLRKKRQDGGIGLQLEGEHNAFDSDSNGVYFGDNEVEINDDARSSSSSSATGRQSIMKRTSNNDSFPNSRTGSKQSSKRVRFEGTASEDEYPMSDDVASELSSSNAGKNPNNGASSASCFRPSRNKYEKNSKRTNRYNARTTADRNRYNARTTADRNLDYFHNRSVVRHPKPNAMQKSGTAGRKPTVRKFAEDHTSRDTQLELEAGRALSPRKTKSSTEGRHMSPEKIGISGLSAKSAGGASSRGSSPKGKQAQAKPKDAAAEAKKEAKRKGGAAAVKGLGSQDDLKKLLGEDTDSEEEEEEESDEGGMDARQRRKLIRQLEKQEKEKKYRKIEGDEESESDHSVIFEPEDILLATGQLQLNAIKAAGSYCEVMLQIDKRRKKALLEFLSMRNPDKADQDYYPSIVPTLTVIVFVQPALFFPRFAELEEFELQNAGVESDDEGGEGKDKDKKDGEGKEASKEESKEKDNEGSPGKKAVTEAPPRNTISRKELFQIENPDRPLDMDSDDETIPKLITLPDPGQISVPIHPHPESVDRTIAMIKNRTLRDTDVANRFSTHNDEWRQLPDNERIGWVRQGFIERTPNPRSVIHQPSSMCYADPLNEPKTLKEFVQLCEYEADYKRNSKRCLKNLAQTGELELADELHEIRDEEYLERLHNAREEYVQALLEKDREAREKAAEEERKKLMAKMMMGTATMTGFDKDKKAGEMKKHDDSQITSSQTTSQEQSKEKKEESLGSLEGSSHVYQDSQESKVTVDAIQGAPDITIYGEKLSDRERVMRKAKLPWVEKKVVKVVEEENIFPTFGKVFGTGRYQRSEDIEMLETRNRWVQLVNPHSTQVAALRNMKKGGGSPARGR